MSTIEFKPKQVTKKLISVLDDRPRYVLTQRFGLGTDPNIMTLEAIGKSYDITRERVRQIENFALNAIRKSSAYTKEQIVFDELRDIAVSLGGIVDEESLLEHINKDKKTQNHIRLLLVLGDHFSKEKENKEYRQRWSVDKDVSDKVHKALKSLANELTKDDLIPESKMIETLAKAVVDIADEYRNEEIIKRWLGISKLIGRNSLGEWGIADSANINARGIRDYAYLVIRRHGSPLHFREVAKAIADVFERNAHVATCHNELIKDPRFVLVGRGLYALKEWGYEGGVVKDVIQNLLKKHGPLSKADIIKKVLNERYVKENTIVVNLQDSRLFSKDDKGLYISV